MFTVMVLEDPGAALAADGDAVIEKSAGATWAGAAAGVQPLTAIPSPATRLIPKENPARVARCLPALAAYVLVCAGRADRSLSRSPISTLRASP